MKIQDGKQMNVRLYLMFALSPLKSENRCEAPTLDHIILGEIPRVEVSESFLAAGLWGSGWNSPKHFLRCVDRGVDSLNSTRR